MASSPLNVLFLTSQPDLGSAICRGRQIAGARDNWRFASSVDDLDDATDAVVLVKFWEPDWVPRLAGRTVVLDALDYWAQPQESLFYDDVAGARLLFRRRVEGLPLAGVVHATQTMAQILGDLAPNPVCIYHHGRPGQAVNPIRDEVMVVGYEGNPAFLGEWGPALAGMCGHYGIKFDPQAGDLADVDVVVAVRGRQARGTLEVNFKSNVKLANAMAAGTPVILWPEMGYAETQPADETVVRWFQNPEAFLEGLESLLPRGERVRTGAALRAAYEERFTLDRIAAEYETYLLTVAGRAAA